MAVIHYYVVMPCHELRFSHSHIRLSQICDVSVGNNFKKHFIALDTKISCYNYTSKVR